MKKFTLIELLVVVAIIGILASLLLPSLGKSRQTAIAMVCVNKMKQIHIAQTMYSDDNDQEMMRVQTGDRYWWRDIAPYTGYGVTGPGASDIALDRLSDQNIFKCPNAVLDVDDDAEWTKYGYAIFAGNSEAANVNRHRAVISNNVSDPVNALMLMDTFRWRFQAGSWNAGNANDQRRLHNNTTNTIFVDGHAKTKVRELYQIQISSDQNYWYQWSDQQGK